MAFYSEYIQKGLMAAVVEPYSGRSFYCENIRVKETLTNLVVVDFLSHHWQRLGHFLR